MAGSAPSDSKETGKSASGSSTNLASSQSSSAEIPWLPTLATTSPNNYGGLNPENEANLNYINGVTGKEFRHNPRLHSSSAVSRDHSQSDEMKGMSIYTGFS